MGGGIPPQLTATPRPALLFLKSLATGGDWPRPGPHQPPGAGPGPHCLVWGWPDAPEAGPGQPRPGGPRAGAPGGLGERPGRGSARLPGGERGWSPGGRSGTKPRSECHVSRNPLLTLGQHSAPPGPPSPKPPLICAAPGPLDTFLWVSILIRLPRSPGLTPRTCAILPRPRPAPQICSLRP